MAEAAAKGHDQRSEQDPTRQLAIGIARAFGGAIFFALPLLMTMEMWWLGFYMDRSRLALFMTLMVFLLIALDHYSGFKETSSWGEDVLDGFIAFGVGFAAAAAVLFLFDVIDVGMPLREVVGKVAVQAVPASFGAVLAASQLGGGDQTKQKKKERETGYAAEVLFMAAGAVFLAFNVAPTEEMILISFKMSDLHALGLAVASLLMMHAFVYAVDFRGSPAAPAGTPWWSLFLRFTVVGYAVSLVISAYVLWTFGRFEDTALASYVQMTIVLGFPASLGAAAARLIL